MKMDNRKGAPEMDRIQELLGAFRPRPSAAFQERMQDAPWNQRPGGLQGLLSQIHLRRRLALSLTVLTALLTIGLVFSSPNIQAVARQLFTFLRPAPSDSLDLPIGDARLQRYSDPGYFDLSLDEASATAGFELLEIPDSDGQTRFTGAHHDPKLNAVTLRYTHAGQPLYFTQRPLGTVEEFASIGASAPVEIVSLRGVEGEYVSGGWRTPDRELQTPPATLELEWDPRLPQHTLRWEEGQIVYEILAVGDPQMDKSGMLALAESVK